MRRYRAGLTGTVGRLRRGDTALDAYYETVHSRVADVEEELRAFVDTPDASATRADVETTRRRSERVPARPPLYGVPIGVKDIFNVDGYPTRAGSRLPPALFEGPESPVVTRLREAGAVVLGKTVTTEFAHAATGPTRNPHDPGHTPGGSSSGSAAAVAAGLVPLALGTQTIGSVIRPAAFCGVVGFKPSAGRLSTDGVVPFSPSADQVGLFTQDLPGMALAAGVACPNWTPRPSVPPVGPSPPTVGVPAGPYLDQASATGRGAFEAWLETLDGAGVAVRRLSVFEDVDALDGLHWSMVRAEAAVEHAAWYLEHGAQYEPESAQLVEAGRAVPLETLGRARVNRRLVRRRIERTMHDAGVDVLASPAAVGPAPAGLSDSGDPVMNLPWTHAGVPAVSLPVTKTAGGLPLGLQCVAPHGEDERLLAAAGALAARLPTPDPAGGSDHSG